MVDSFCALLDRVMPECNCEPGSSGPDPNPPWQCERCALLEEHNSVLSLAQAEREQSDLYAQESAKRLLDAAAKLLAQAADLGEIVTIAREVYNAKPNELLWNQTALQFAHMMVATIKIQREERATMLLEGVSIAINKCLELVMKTYKLTGWKTIADLKMNIETLVFDSKTKELKERVS